MRLVAMAAAEFRHPDRQIAIALDPLAKYQDVRWAIHRLQRHQIGIAGEDLAFVLNAGHLVGHHEHVLAIFAPMPGLLPLPRVHQLRGLHLLIAGGIEPAAHIGFQRAPDHIALGMPEHRSLRLRLEVEQIHFLADLAVIALGRFLEAEEVLVELLLVQPAGPIDAAQHRVVLVAAPIGARHARQLEGAGIKPARGGEVRAAAHVEPRILAAPRLIDRQLLAFRQLGCPFRLERLALRVPAPDQVFAAPHLADQRLVARDDPAHLRFDRRQVLLGKGPLGGSEVVIEAVIGRRAEGDLRAGKQRLHRFGEDMSEIVPHQLQRVGFVARRHQGERGIALECPMEIAQLTIDTRRQRRLGEPRSDRRGDVRRRSPRRNLARRTVGQGNAEHG